MQVWPWICCLRGPGAVFYLVGVMPAVPRDTRPAHNSGRLDRASLAGHWRLFVW